MTPLAAAIKNAKKQGLITLRGIQRDTGISRNTARRIMRGAQGAHPATERALWNYLAQKGAL